MEAVREKINRLPTPEEINTFFVAHVLSCKPVSTPDPTKTYDGGKYLGDEEIDNDFSPEYPAENPSFILPKISVRKSA